MASSPGLFGLLNLHKPPDVTSRDVVNQIQRLVRPVKCGHAGTLDPMATGVLLVCVGPATRLVPLLHELPKTYVSRFLLGATSDTDDITGQVTPSDRDDVPPSHSAVEQALAQQTGLIDQTPPAYSAVHVGGRRAYRLARSGQTPELQPKRVEIHRMHVLAYNYPRLDVEIVCGSGTYIRSIARDLGCALGCGGLMSELTRTAVGDFRVESADSPDAVTAETLQQLLVPAVHLVSHLPQYRCTSDQQRDVARGKAIRVTEADMLSTSSATMTRDAPRIALLSGDGTQLLALGEARTEDASTVLQPRTVFIARE